MTEKAYGISVCMSVRSHGTENYKRREDAQFSNSRRVSLCRASMDTRDCRLLIAGGGEQEVGGAARR